MAAISMLLGSTLLGGINVAQAALLTEEEHWKYRIDKWLWDEDRRRTYGLITPQIVIQNETADRLEGYVADANGTPLTFYDGDQVVRVRYMSNGTGPSDWQMAGRVYDGYFVIDIPEKNKEAELVKIFIGNSHYVVNDGTETTPQTEVVTNTAIGTYRTNSTLDQIQKEELAMIAAAAGAQQEESSPFRNVYEGGSLIDWILGKNGLLPIRSPDPSK